MRHNECSKLLLIPLTIAESQLFPRIWEFTLALLVVTFIPAANVRCNVTMFLLYAAASEFIFPYKNTSPWQIPYADVSHEAIHPSGMRIAQDCLSSRFLECGVVALEKFYQSLPCGLNYVGSCKDNRSNSMNMVHLVLWHIKARLLIGLRLQARSG